MNDTTLTKAGLRRATRRFRHRFARSGIAVVAVLCATSVGAVAVADVVTPGAGVGLAAAQAPAAAALPQVTQQIAKEAVPTGATGFKLGYVFGHGLQPTDRQFDSEVSYDQNFDWTDDVGHKLQWDFPMPEDGHHTVTFTAGLVDYGKVMDYQVRYTSTINRTGGSIAVSTECAILKGGAPAAEAPFTCEGGSAQSASGAALAVSTVSEQNWSSITGIIDVRNEGSGPRISLAQGTFSTPNQQRRIIMNGAAWYPTDATDEQKLALPYATIANGGQLTWMAAQQNTGISQTEPDTHAQATFAYRIMLDGESTPYWINGSAETYKWDSWGYPTATCSIFIGDPNTTGTPVGVKTPFTCEPTGMTKPNLNTDDDTTFQVRMARVDTLSNNNDAKLRGIVQACSEGGGGCIQTVGEPALHVSDAAGAKVGEPNPNTQGEPKAKEWKFSQKWSREVSNSVEQTFGMTTSFETEVSFMGVKGKLGVELTSETAYGYDLTKGIEYEFADYPAIPFGAIGYYVQFEAWNVYRGDLYFFGEGNSWYRVTGADLTIPIDASTYGAKSVHDGSLAPKTGADFGRVQFRCVWDDDKHQANVLLHNSTVEALTACQIPDTWNDKVPAVPGVELDPDLIRDARAILAGDRVELEKSLQEAAERLGG